MSYRKNRYPQTPKKAEPREPLHGEAFCTNPGVERSFYANSLTSGLPYQRPVEEKEVDRLISEWDERLLDPIIVSFRDGRFNVVDGQHRIAALRKMNHGNDVMVMCKVYSGLTYAQEAELCYKLDKAKKRLSLSQSTNALAESGADAEVSAVKKMVESHGFIWALNQKGGKANEIATTRATMNAYKLLGASAFTRLVKLLRNTWDGDPRSLTAYVISGLALFIETYAVDMDDRIFVAQLSKVDPNEIICRGKLDYSTTKKALRYARVMLEKYNGQRKEAKKLPYRF